MRAIVITGSSGLIGAALARALMRAGQTVIGIDARLAPTTAHVLHLKPDDDDIDALIAQARGIVHLAGVTRVKWGEQDRAACWRENVTLTRRIVEAARRAPHRPWLIHASSREVYGEPIALPASDDAPVAPLNIYGASKAAAEALILQAAAADGLSAGILRFSTVYGGREDHADRVLPAFVGQALRREPLTVHGAEVVLDPTWLGDAVAALRALIESLSDGCAPPRPMLISGGTGISLLDLARRTCALVGSSSAISLTAPRDYDAARFTGAPRDAARWLGWRATVPLEEGIMRYAHMLSSHAEAYAVR